MYRSDKTILDQTEELAKMLMLKFYSRVSQSNTLFRDTEDRRGQFCWTTACEIQNLLTQTNPNDCEYWDDIDESI